MLCYTVGAAGLLWNVRGRTQRAHKPGHDRQRPSWGSQRRAALTLARRVAQVLSAAALRLSLHGSLSTAFYTYAALLHFFIIEYVCFEVMHLYTYDIFAERLGFKIAWGCLAWYPFHYCSGVWPAVLAPP
eukprot:4513916-Prymnesium_polylepis.1